MSEILLVVVLVLFNGFFALSEMAVITSRKGRLKELGRESRGARKALEVAEHPEAFLSAVQVWITLLSLVTGYFGGESIGNKLEVLKDYPVPKGCTSPFAPTWIAYLLEHQK